MNNTINAIYKNVEKLKEDTKKEMETLSGQIEKDKAAVDQVTSEMEKATASGDLKAYQAAKAKKANAEDSLEMHSFRYNALKLQPVMDPEKIEATRKEIRSQVKAEENELATKVVKLAEEIQSLCDEYAETVNKANAAMTGLHELGRGKVNPETITDWAVYHWGMMLVRNNKYTELTGKQVRK